MEKNTSSEASNHSDSQEISQLL